MDNRLLLCCDKGSSSYNLSTPWIVNGWWYASDGRVCVRVPVLPDDEPEAPSEGKRPCVADVWKKWQDVDPNTASSWPEKPKDGHSEDCQRCNGTGCELQECKTCDGFGQHCCDECGGEHDCGKCEGEGSTPIKGTVCCMCGGSKRVPEPFDIGTERISGMYWRLIQQFGDVHYCQCDKDSLAFVAAGGLQGIVMGMVRP